MPNAFLQGIQGSFDNQAQVRNDVHVVAINWFVNRCPLVTRVPRVPGGSTTFTMVNRSFRNRLATLTAAASATDAQISLADASALMNGDVLELASGERVELVADPNVFANTVTVRRGAEGTTPAASASGDLVRLIGNCRTGGEVNQSGVAFKPVGVNQYCQTWQHPVQVSGSLQASLGYQAQSGLNTPFEQNKMDALQNLMDDMEYSSYYGRGEDPSVSGRPKQKGLRALLGSNLVTAPTSAAGVQADRPDPRYAGEVPHRRRRPGRADRVDELHDGPGDLGPRGAEDQRGLDRLRHPDRRVRGPVPGWRVADRGPAAEAVHGDLPHLLGGRLRMKRNEFWSARGSRGDAFEGDWIAEGAIEIENQSHHAWVEGITAFSAV